RNHLEFIVRQDLVSNSICLGLAQCVCLCLSTRLCHCLGKIGKDNGEPQPKRNLNAEKDIGSFGDCVLNDVGGGQSRTYLDDEHDRILRHELRVKFDE